MAGIGSIDDIYRDIKDLAQKNGYNGFISPKDIERRFNNAQVKYAQSLYKRYEQTQHIGDSLSKLITAPTSIVVDSNGKFTLPADLFHIDSITHTISDVPYPVVKTGHDRVGSRLSSTIEPPTAEFPIYVRFDTYLQFYPKSLGSADMVYIKYPTAVVWGYTLFSGQPVYDEATSTDPIWDELDIISIKNLILMDLGVIMSDQNLENFALTQSKLSQ